MVVLVEPNPALDVDLGAWWSYGGTASPGMGVKVVSTQVEGESEAFINEPPVSVRG